MFRRPLSHYVFDAAIVLAVAALVALCVALTMPDTAKAAPTPACTVKTWQGQPYAFCGAHHCASIDNRTNRIAWASATRHGATRYRDLDGIRPHRPIPGSVRPAYRAALAALTAGKAGPKVATVCVGH